MGMVKTRFRQAAARLPEDQRFKSPPRNQIRPLTQKVGGRFLFTRGSLSARGSTVEARGRVLLRSWVKSPPLAAFRQESSVGAIKRL